MSFFFSTGIDEFADFSSAFTQSMSLDSNAINICKLLFLQLYSKNCFIKFLQFIFLANQKTISNTDLLTSLPQSSTNGISRNLLDLNFDALGNTGNIFVYYQMFTVIIICYFVWILLYYLLR